MLLVATLMFIEHLMYSGHGTAAVEGLPLYSFSDLEGRYHPIINLILKRGRLKVKWTWLASSPSNKKTHLMGEHSELETGAGQITQPW